MSDHDLQDDFPADAKWLQRLKVEGAEFQALADCYHELADLMESERIDIPDKAAALVPVRKAA